MDFKEKNEYKPNEDSLTHKQLKVILNDLVTPKMVDCGLNKYDGRYTWFSDFNELGIKKVFKYQLLKGDSGTFVYGNCFKFAPTYTKSGSISIINHRTDKTTRLHIQEITEGWRNSLFGGGINTDLTNHRGDGTCRDSICKLLSKYLPIMTSWWLNNQTIEQNIKTADYQTITHGFGFSDISPNYIKAFLIAKLGKKSEAINILNNELKREIEHNQKFEKLLEKLTFKINTDANTT